MSKDLNDRVKLVFVGIRFDGKKKIFDFREIDPDGGLKGARSFVGMKALGRPGAIYSFEVPEDRSSAIYPSTMEYLGHWEHKDQVTTWQAAYDAAMSADRRRRRKEREGRRNYVHEALGPIREAYRRMSAGDRRILLIDVIAYIQGEGRR